MHVVSFETTCVVFLHCSRNISGKGGHKFPYLSRVNYFYVSLFSFNPTLYSFGLQTYANLRNQKNQNLLISFI